MRGLLPWEKLPEQKMSSDVQVTPPPVLTASTIEPGAMRASSRGLIPMSANRRAGVARLRGLFFRRQRPPDGLAAGTSTASAACQGLDESLAASLACCTFFRHVSARSFLPVAS